MYKFFATTAMAVILSGAAHAKVSPEQAERLGGDELTPVGAERAGNEDGSIPPWTGGIQELPEDYEVGDRLVDPYEDDEVLYTITAKNYQQYEEFLSPGQIALLKRYPDTFYMNVYPTRRSSLLPEAEYERVKEGATVTEMVPSGNGLENFVSTVPFPIPSEALHVIWNHIVRYRSPQTVQRRYTQIPAQANGDFSPVLFEEKAISANRVPDDPCPSSAVRLPGGDPGAAAAPRATCC
ncbi:MAG: DUF1329 domain-containing protein [Halioglobus sp.]|nr:DUF1329 domain-containing protein [Halioglobus sp.]